MRSRGDDMTSPGQSRVRTGTMKTTIHVLSLVLNCCLLVGVIFLGVVVMNVKLSVSQLDENTEAAIGDLSNAFIGLQQPLQPPGGIPEGLEEHGGKGPEKQLTDSNPTSIPWTENLQRLEKTEATVMDQQYKSEKKRATTDVNRPSSSCPRGYQKYRGVCYKPFETRQQFHEAAAACIADGGTLAMPRDAGINAFLISLIDSAKFKFANFWFGLHSQRENGKWDWIDGTPLGTNFSMWAEGQPSDIETGIQRCVLYWGINQNLWNDYGCVGTANFICQIVP
ncbi:CD209 antigen-like protein 2 [Branchiostoma floridae x Branchiostoma japonicum]